MRRQLKAVSQAGRPPLDVDCLRYQRRLAQHPGLKAMIVYTSTLYSEFIQLHQTLCVAETLPLAGHPSLAGCHWLLNSGSISRAWCSSPAAARRGRRHHPSGPFGTSHNRAAGKSCSAAHVFCSRVLGTKLESLPLLHPLPALRGHLKEAPPHFEHPRSTSLSQSRGTLCQARARRGRQRSGRERTRA